MIFTIYHVAVAVLEGWKAFFTQHPYIYQKFA
jgi:hypothetical protein